MTAKEYHYYLSVADYIICAGVIIISTAFGVGYGLIGKGTNTREKFYVGDRSMHFIPVAISLLVTYKSSNMMLGAPAEIYIYGSAALLLPFSFFICNMLATAIMVPLFRPLNLTSGFQYLELRFKSKAVRLSSVVFSIVSTLLYMGIVLFGPAVTLEAVTGINPWYSVITLAVSAVIFTAVGGLKSVVWCDVFQAAIMFSGIFAVIIKGSIDIGGSSKVFEYAKQGGRLDVFNFDPDPTVRHTVWTLIIPPIFHHAIFAFSQSTIQRISASNTDSAAKRMMLMTALMAFAANLLVAFEGLVIYSYFSQQEVEPLSCGILTNSNQIVPYTVLYLFHHMTGMPGLFLAALFCASLSTMSSGLSSLSILVMEDLVKPFIRTSSESRLTLYAKISVLVLGILSCLCCAIITQVEGPLPQLSAGFRSAGGGAVVGLFLLGAFFPSATSVGALSGAIVSFIFCTVLTMGQHFAPGVRKTPWLPLGNGSCPNSNDTSIMEELSLNHTNIYTTSTPDTDTGSTGFNFFNLSYALNTFLGSFLTISIAVIVSYITGRNRPGDVDPRYILNLSDTVFVWLPLSVRRWMKNIGTQYKDGVTYKCEDPSSTNMMSFDKEEETKEDEIKCSEPLMYKCEDPSNTNMMSFDKEEETKEDEIKCSEPLMSNLSKTTTEDDKPK